MGAQCPQKVAGSNVVVIKATDISGQNLSNCELIASPLANKFMYGTNFGGSRLWRANFRGSIGNKTGSQQTKFDGADLTLVQFGQGNSNNASDFSNASFMGAYFDKASLSQSYFNGALFDGAELHGANLVSGSQFNGASFRSAIFSKEKSKANINSVFFNGAFFGPKGNKTTMLNGVVFTMVVAQKADFTGASLEGARFNSAQGVDPSKVTSTDISYAKFINANLKNATFNAAIGLNTDFTGADLTNAIFEQNTDQYWAKRSGKVLVGNLASSKQHKAIGCNFTGAIFRNAKLNNAKMEFGFYNSADFTGADLAGARLNGSQFNNIKADATTKMPDGKPYNVSTNNFSAYNQPFPQGNYQGSCQDCSYNHGVLTCSCKNQSQNLASSSIAVSPHDTVYNNDGNLTKK